MSNEILTIPMQQPTSGSGGKKSWFEAMADAWGRALDDQAERIRVKSEEVGNAPPTTDVNAAQDSPSDITELTAMSLKMSFLASSSHTAISSVGSALESMARKQ
jgi:hypothetical protein